MGNFKLLIVLSYIAPHYCGLRIFTKEQQPESLGALKMPILPHEAEALFVALKVTFHLETGSELDGN